MSKIDQAKVAIEQGNIDFAQRTLAELIIEEPQNIEGWLLLSQVVPPQQAIECLNRVLAIEPNHEEALERLGTLQKPESYLEVMDFSIEEIAEELPHKPSLEEETGISDQDIIPEIEVETAAEPFSLDNELLAAKDTEQSEEITIDISLEEALSAESLSDISIEEEISENTPTSENIPQEMQEGSFIAETDIPSLDDESLPSFSEADREKEIWEDSTEPPPSPPTAAKSKIKKKPGLVHPFIKGAITFIALCALIISAVYWYYQDGPCGINKIGNAYLKMNNLVLLWDKEMALASRSSRLTIMDPIMKMVDIRRELRKMDVPQCMQPVWNELELSMAFTLEAYDKFLRYEGELEILKKFQQAALHRKMYERRLQELFSCAPFSCSQ